MGWQCALSFHHSDSFHRYKLLFWKWSLSEVLYCLLKSFDFLSSGMHISHGADPLQQSGAFLLSQELVVSPADAYVFMIPPTLGD